MPETINNTARTAKNGAARNSRRGLLCNRTICVFSVVLALIDVFAFVCNYWYLVSTDVARYQALQLAVIPIFFVAFPIFFVQWLLLSIVRNEAQENSCEFADMKQRVLWIQLSVLITFFLTCGVGFMW